MRKGPKAKHIHLKTDTTFDIIKCIRLNSLQRCPDYQYYTGFTETFPSDDCNKVNSLK